MSHAKFSISIIDVVNLLGLEKNPRDRVDSTSFNVRCPFCGTGKKSYKMNINTVKNVYFCVKCMDSATGGSGALDLYGRVRFGTPLIPGVNGKQLYHSLACELEGDNGFSKPKQDESKEEVYEIEPAPNEMLDKVYRSLLSLPYVSLTRHHGFNLMKRGLDRETIAKNHYGSLRTAKKILAMHPRAAAALAWYDTHKIDMAKREVKALKAYSKDEIVAGMLIARDLMADGLDLTGVPGFFRIGGVWCFRYDVGMIVPTVNIDGHIVGMQIRRDVATKAGLRYMTVSSKGLDGGVTTQIARTHVAKSCEIDEHTAVYITEGPLKADIILYFLLKRNLSNVAVIAIQGVNNTKELPGLTKILHNLGITKAYNALDMDKCTNMSVARASRSIRKIFKDNGIELRSLFWDNAGARTKYDELSRICLSNGLTVPSTGNVFMDVYTMAYDLSKNNIKYCVHIVDGKEIKDGWNNTQKGLDDHLLAKSGILQR